MTDDDKPVTWDDVNDELGGLDISPFDISYADGRGYLVRPRVYIRTVRQLRLLRELLEATDAH